MLIILQKSNIIQHIKQRMRLNCMPRAKKKIKYEMSESEQMIMDYLWEHPEGKLFPEIVEYLNTTYQKEWAKQTINTFII